MWLINKLGRGDMTMARAEAHLSGPGKDLVYLGFYGLKQPPFSITPDPEYLYFSRTHQSAIEKILYGINSRMGFTLLIGEVGTGKTTICRSMLDTLNGKAETVYIINPSLSGKELISTILDDLGINYPPNSKKKDLIDQLNRFLLSDKRTGPVVIIIDDAQTMPAGALEDLRLLSNLETDKEKLLQMVLVGQPELIDLISRPEMRQLRQRITIHCRLDFLTRDEIEGYISRRLFIAGDTGQLRFTPGARRLIYKFSRGIPRLINKICDYALVAGYVANVLTIGPAHIKIAIAEMGSLDFEDDSGQVRRVGSTSKRARKKLISRWLPSLALIASSLVIFLLVVCSGGPINFSFSGPWQTTRPASNLTRHTLASTNKITMKITDNLETRGVVPLTKFRFPYTLHLGSFKDIQRAYRAASIYKDKGAEVHWSPVDVQERGMRFRLVAGCFETKKEAKEFQKDSGLIDSRIIKTPYTVLVGEFNSPEEVDQIRSMLKKNQFDSYSVKSDDGNYRLLTGAFMSREGAAKLAQELNKILLMTRVVLR